MSEPSDSLREQFGDIDIPVRPAAARADRFGNESARCRLRLGKESHFSHARRLLVDHERLLNVTQELSGSLLDALESTVVHEQRSMGTWVVRNGSCGT
jgi:hypothetical protein